MRKLVNGSRPLTISTKSSVSVVWLFVATLICLIISNKSITNVVIQTLTRNRLLKIDGNMISTIHPVSFKSNYHDNYKCTHTTLFNNEFVNSGNSLLDKSLQ